MHISTSKDVHVREGVLQSSRAALADLLASAKYPVQFDQAMNYVNRLKDRFPNEDSVYKRFLEILNKYRKAEWGIRGRCQ